MIETKLGSAMGYICNNKGPSPVPALMCWRASVLRGFGGVLLMLCSLWPSAGYSLSFTNGIEDSSWRFEGSVFGCSLVHAVPYYGEAVFKTRAGELASFALKPEAERLKTGKAVLKLQPPAWRHNLEPIDLGYVPVTQGRTPVSLDAIFAERLLAELLNGYEMAFTREPWYGAQAPTTVNVSPIGFRDVYQRYLGCLANLLPVNFDQVRRTAVYFGSSLFEPLPPSQKLKLDNIVRYCKADPSVVEFYIDGHTDSVGTRADNYLLAENRAKEVHAYLASKGLPSDKIVVRWHGERYPTSTNATIDGRAKNRRVTVRLERDPALIPAGAQ